MDSDKEVRGAVLAIVKAHAQMRSDYHELLDRLYTLKRVDPKATAQLRTLRGERKTSTTEEVDLASRLGSALNSNQSFAALLQEYAHLWEVPLDEHIQNLTRAGFQTTVD